MRLAVWLLLLAFTAVAGAQAQGTPPPASSYGGLGARPIKALSPQQIDGLRAGHGMAMALPAELNRYPGPMHVLDLADALQLTVTQRQRLTTAMADMRRAAVALGERLIALEAELDRLFASAAADGEAIDRLTAAIGAVQGELRAAHLRTHVTTRDVLSGPQIAAYVQLRGYDGAPPPAGGHDGRHRH
jgi:hypothetical protein